ncbi:MAG: FHA domain-containing protein [Bdellovibrionales bacterium]|nr:FHA domain-containing protein [Bdellovibrionales bacterium]
MLQLKIIKGPAGQGRAFSLSPGRTLTVGRSEACEVRLPSVGISKTHCKLTATSGSRAEIEDLGSSNGTFVNGLLIKKHVIKPGDTVTLSDFVFSVIIEAPTPTNAGTVNNVAEAITSTPSPSSTPPSNAPLAVRVLGWMESNLYPWADRLSNQYDVRMLTGVFFVVWSMLIILMTIGPFSEKANDKVRSESIQVARLYARQLVRLNQQAIIDQRYRDLVTELDARKGQTPGVIDAMILDVSKAQILAPTELIGRGLPNNFARIATSKDEEHVQLESDGTAYVSAPVKIGTADGVNKTVATAFVVYNPTAAQFSFANLLDQIVTSMLLALIVSIVFIVFLYRWIEGSLLKVAASIDEAIKTSNTTVAAPVIWPALSQICEVASSALSRAAGGRTGMAPAGDDAWATACVSASPVAAAAFNPQLTVTAWNTGMEQIVGIRASIAVGSDISGASRDVSFESAIRDLAASTSITPWMPADRRLEFGGRPFRLTMLSGNGAIFITLTPREE